MADKFPLRPAVAFAEGVQSVQLAEVMCGTVAECGGVKSGKVLFFRKLLEDRRGGAGDMGMMGEHIAALANVDGPQLPGPFVHVAEQVAVDCLQVGTIKTAFQRCLRKRVRARGDKGRFGLFERGFVGDAEAIIKTPDAGSR